MCLIDKTEQQYFNAIKTFTRRRSEAALIAVHPPRATNRGCQKGNDLIFERADKYRRSTSKMDMTSQS